MLKDTGSMHSIRKEVPEKMMSNQKRKDGNIFYEEGTASAKGPG